MAINTTQSLKRFTCFRHKGSGEDIQELFCYDKNGYDSAWFTKAEIGTLYVSKEDIIYDLNQYGLVESDWTYCITEVDVVFSPLTPITEVDVVFSPFDPISDTLTFDK